MRNHHFSTFGEEDDPPVSQQQLAVKLTTLFSLLAASLLAGLTPLVIDAISKFLVKRSSARAQTRKRILSCTQTVFTLMDCAQGFAAGILLGGGLMHLLPEVNEELPAILAKWGASEQIQEYPWAMMACILTIAILYFLDTVLLQVASSIFQSRQKKKKKHNHHHHHHHHHNNKKSHHEASPTVAVSEQQQQVYSTFQQQPAEPVPVPASKNHHVQESAPLVHHVEDPAPTQEEEGGHHHHDHHHDDHHHHSHDHGAEVIGKLISGFVLWLCLSCHSFFEGLGLGSTTNDKQMWSLFAAIVSHKLVESFACGVVVFRSMSNRLAVVLFMILFAAMTPIGIGIGIAIASVHNLIFSFIQNLILAFASGAFLYVALFEIMGNHSHFEGEEHEKEQQRKSVLGKNLFNILRYTLFITGFALSAVLKIFDMKDDE